VFGVCVSRVCAYASSMCAYLEHACWYLSWGTGRGRQVQHSALHHRVAHGPRGLLCVCTLDVWRQDPGLCPFLVEREGGSWGVH